MKKISTIFILLALFGNSFGQSLLTTQKRVNSRGSVQSREVLDISGSIESSNYYINGQTLDLLFTLNVYSPDEEFADQIIMTFPQGVKPNSGTDPFPGVSSQTESEKLFINGQKVTWGDNDNDYGGISAPGSYSFFVNVTVDTNIVGDLEIPYSVSGDQYKGTIHEFTGTVKVKPLPETAELKTSVTGYVGEYYRVPLEQATFAPSAQIFNLGNTLSDTITFFAKANNGYTDSTIIDFPINTSDTKDFIFSDFTATEKGDVTFTFSNNYTKDVDPNVKPTKKSININNNVLARDNGKINGHIGLNGAGGQIGHIFTITKTDTLTAVQFTLGTNATIGDIISVKVRSFENGKPGAEIGKSLPIKVVKDTIYNAGIFPAVVLAPGKYYIGVVQGENNIDIATTSTPYVPHTAWAYFNNKWNDIGALGYQHTYYIRGIFDNYKEVQNDIKLESIDTKGGYAVGNIDIVGTIRNLSNVNILNEFDVDYAIDGGSKVSYHLSGLSLNPGETYSFKHGTPYDATTGSHEVAVSISKPNGNDDENKEDNKLTKNFMVVNEVFTKVVVGEEATGTWCGWCVRGHVGLKDMQHNYSSDEWIGIAVHNGDPMKNDEYDSNISSMVAGYPSGVINREFVADPGAFEDTYNEIKDEVPIVKVEISKATFDTDTRNIYIAASSIAALDLENTNYRLSMVVIEDGVAGSGSGYAQANYYASNGITIKDWEGIDWSKLGDPIPANKMVYNHVGRYLVGGWSGIQGSVPSTLKYNEKNEYDFVSKLPAAYNENNIRVAVLLLDNTTGIILNAAEAEIEVTTGTTTIGNPDDVNIYPNPTRDYITINADKGAKISIYNTIGKVVLRSEMTENTKTLSLSNLNKGSYFVEIFNNNKVYSKKIVIIK